MLSQPDRWEHVAKTVLRNRRKSVAGIAAQLRKEYGELSEITGGDELYPNDTTWYFTAPGRG